MTKGTSQNEQMPNKMIVGNSLNCVKYNSNTIKYASKKQKS